MENVEIIKFTSVLIYTGGGLGWAWFILYINSPENRRPRWKRNILNIFKQQYKIDLKKKKKSNFVQHHNKRKYELCNNWKPLL